MDVLSFRLFLRVADLGGVSAAARDLSLSPASASARLHKLEETVGFRLFNRTTRAVSLTTDGAAFLPYVQQAVEILEAGLGATNGHGEQAQGVLRMTMPGSFGRMHSLSATQAWPIVASLHENWLPITVFSLPLQPILSAVEFPLRPGISPSINVWSLQMATGGSLKTDRPLPSRVPSLSTMARPCAI